MRRLTITHDRFALAQAFTISRGSKTHAEVLTVSIQDGPHRGRGECVPYARYGESLDSVSDQILSIEGQLADGLDVADLQTALPPGAARNAVDCALWDLAAKQSNTSVAQLLRMAPLHGVETAYTLSLGSPEDMAQAAHGAAQHPLLKIKLGGPGDIARINAIRSAAPMARLIVDANEAWTQDTLIPNMLACADAGVAMVEQPLPASEDSALADIPHPVPICADESAHTSDGLSALKGRYDIVNVKLDKTGGLTEAMRMVQCARADGFGVMVGCMVGSSLAMAPATIPAQLASYVDLDAPLLLSEDRDHALHYTNSTLAPPTAALWG